LDSRTLLLGSSVKDILKRTEGKRKGIDFKLYTTNPNDKDKQTVMNFLSSMDNPDPVSKKDKDDVDRLLAESLDRIILSDRVRSCNDYFKVNIKKDFGNSMSITYS
jgi:hypothetical protein